MTTTPTQPTEFISHEQAASLQSMPFGDTRDFEATQRGFIDKLEPCVVLNAAGDVI